MTTKTTLGQLVEGLYSQYERAYADEEIAAVATQVTLDDMMNARARRNRKTTTRVTAQPKRKAA